MNARNKGHILKKSNRGRRERSEVIDQSGGKVYFILFYFFREGLFLT